MRPGLRLATLLFVLFAGFTGIVAAAENGDPHLSDSAAVLYQRSAFAHGYLHGYEEGFHRADLAIQMGHTLPGIRPRRNSLEVNPGYRSGYGDKSLFIGGFKMGLRAGYADSLAGREFRAIADLRQAAEELRQEQDARQFDHAFADGYWAGAKTGSSEPRVITDFGYVGAYCRTRIKPPEAGQPQYCEGYARGYRLGYGDGRNLQQDTAKAVETAQNSK